MLCQLHLLCLIDLHGTFVHPMDPVLAAISHLPEILCAMISLEHRETGIYGEFRHARI